MALNLKEGTGNYIVDPFKRLLIADVSYETFTTGKTGGYKAMPLRYGINFLCVL